MEEKALVIVESPAKARTISKFLPKNYVVKSCMGHVRDLPQSAADIPPKYKEEAWSRIGVNVDAGFEPLYVTVKGKGKVIAELRKAVKDADIIYLATDEDREGESISWHLMQLFNVKKPTKRMVFHEITKKAILAALENSREIDERLVRAQETRRILDRLFGYTLSPLIWKKIAYGLSAGRVQSVGLRFLVERERERVRFKKATYWDLKSELEHDGKKFEAKLNSVGDKRIAIGKDFDDLTGKPKKPDEVLVLGEKEAKALTAKLKDTPWEVTQVEEKKSTSRPSQPFITSTLQQEGNRKLGLSTRETMRIAQSLYEQGLITYMRTDSPNLSQQAIDAARSLVKEQYGDEYLSPEPRNFSAKNKQAQEAHEAIRPAGESFTAPEATGLKGKDLSLYELIWKRTVATQMAEARKKSVSVKIKAGDALFAATGTRIEFPGFLRAYVEGSDDPDLALEEREVILPALKEGDKPKVVEVQPHSHETKPIARYTEASLVQMLEREGVGRPSTYATIISTILAREYARKVGNALVPTFTGFAVVQILEDHFQNLVDYSFTSEMEEALDEIADGKRDWKPYLEKFYLGKSGLRSQVESKEKKIDANTSRTVHLLELKDIEVRVGKFGPYLYRDPKKGEELRASIPEDVSPADLSMEIIEEIVERSENGPQSLGKDPETNQDVYVLIGRYGPYAQLGEVTEEVPKPKRASVPKDLDYRNLTLEQGLKLLSLPRELGKHPETGEPISANRGRFGPYIVHQDDFRSLKKDDNVYTVTLERALEILAQEKKTRRGSKVIKDLGPHPDTNKKIQVMEGRYGPYIKFGTKNIKLPEDLKPEEATLEKVLPIIAEKSGGKKKAAKKSAAKKKAVKKKAAKTDAAQNAS